MLDRERDGSKRRSTAGKKRDEDEDIALLDEITQTDEEAGQHWLEYLLIKRRSSVR